jgi:hypothetical protein
VTRTVFAAVAETSWIAASLAAGSPHHWFWSKPRMMSGAPSAARIGPPSTWIVAASNRRPSRDSTAGRRRMRRMIQDLSLETKSALRMGGKPKKYPVDC